MAVITWNPLDKSGFITLSNGNLTSIGSYIDPSSNVRATTSTISGKKYWEITCNSSCNYLSMGVALKTMPINTYLYPPAITTQYWVELPTYRGAISIGTVFGFALDMENKKLDIYRNGVLTYTKTNITGEVIPIIGETDNTGNGNTTINFGATSFMYTPPMGFTSYDGSQANKLNQVSSLIGMAVGDCIPCKYTALTSGVAGYFSELGTCTAQEIPVTGTPTPDGLFYFIKTDKGLLIADRVIQTNISWNVLNAAKYIEGTNIIFNPFANLTSNNSKGVVVSVSSVYSSTYDAWHAFDGIWNSTNGSTSCWSSDSLYRDGGQWLKIDFGTENQKTINSISLRSANYSGNITILKNWILYGSTNDVEYTQITLGTQPMDYNEHTYNFPNTNAYRYYRINVISNYAGDTMYFGGISEMKLGTINMLIRSLSGGCAYADANGNKSTTDCSKGAWPTTNEWDKYIVSSNLNGTITPGDDNVWHWKGIASWCKDTSIANNAYRVGRGYEFLNTYTYTSSAANSTLWSFRPCLEYIEPDGSSKQTNLWY